MTRSHRSAALALCAPLASMQARAQDCDRACLEGGRISEIEQIVVRDTAAAERVETMGSPHPMYLETIPCDRRMSRRDMLETANKYFSGMQQNDGKGDYPFAEDCNRIENGGQATNNPTPPRQTRPDPAMATGYSGQWSCLEQFESGLLHFVNRVPYGMNSGWSSYADGLSGRLQDRTGA